MKNHSATRYRKAELEGLGDVIHANYLACETDIQSIYPTLFTNQFKDDFLSAINLLKEHPSDEYVVDSVEEYTKKVNECMTNALNLFREFRFTLKRMRQIDELYFLKLGGDYYGTVGKNHGRMINFLWQVGQAILSLQTAMSDAGAAADWHSRFMLAHNELRSAKVAQEFAKIERKVTTKKRHKLMIDLYDNFIKQVCLAGKTKYAKAHPKYSWFLIPEPNTSILKRVINGNRKGGIMNGTLSDGEHLSIRNIGDTDLKFYVEENTEEPTPTDALILAPSIGSFLVVNLGTIAVSDAMLIVENKGSSTGRYTVKRME